MKHLPNDLWSHYKTTWKDNLGEDKIYFRGTAGVGDFMYALNISFMRAFINQKPTNLEMHWFHDKDFLYHYEDPETIIERFEFHYNRLMWKDIVHVDHVFNSERKDIWKNRFLNVNRKESLNLFWNYWRYEPRYNRIPINKKVVMWTPISNSFHTWGQKTILTDLEWQMLEDSLTNLGYDVYKVDYRTPISEVFYHIQTCDFCISYEGMWHYISKSFFKPHIVISDQNVTKEHTPFAVMISKKKRLGLKYFPEVLEEARIKAETGKQIMQEFIMGF